MINEIIKFVNGNLQLDVTVSPDNETVWLSQKQMVELFDVKSQAITRHLKNIYNDEELFKEASNIGCNSRNLQLLISKGSNKHNSRGELLLSNTTFSCCYKR